MIAADLGERRDLVLGDLVARRFTHADTEVFEIDRLHLAHSHHPHFVIPGQCEALNPEPRGNRFISNPWVPDRAHARPE